MDCKKANLNSNKCDICKKISKNSKILLSNKINNNVTLAQMLKECTSLKMSELFPNKICNNCLEQLINAYNFKKLVIQNENNYKEYKQIERDISIKTYEINSCYICNRNFSGQQKLIKHINKHTLDSLNNKCEDCHSQFNSTSNLANHQILHKNENFYECAVCENQFSSIKKFQKHFETSHSFYLTCERCHFTTNETKALYTHVQNCLNDYPFFCNICKIKMNDMNILKEHNHILNANNCFKITNELNDALYFEDSTDMEESDNDGINDENFTEEDDLFNEMKLDENNLEFVCKKCNVIFDSKLLLRQHILTHNSNIKNDCQNGDIELKNKKIECRYCQKSFLNLRDCMGHELIHNVDKETIYCKNCPMKFDRQIHYEQHLKAVHTIKKSKNQVKDEILVTTNNSKDGENQTGEMYVEIKIENNLLKCDICNENFQDIKILLQHEYSNHPEREVKCEKCQQIFYRKANYLQHKKAVHGDVQKCFKIINSEDKTLYECTLCKNSFDSLKTFGQHKKDVHDIKIECKKKQPKKYKCERCELEFAKIRLLNMHYKSVHPKDDCKQFLCTQCGKSFFTKRELEVHTRRHNGVKPFKCQICNKSFTTQSEVSVHTKYHTGEKNHICNVCGYRCVRQFSLKRHMRKHTGERPYQCEYCPSRFSQSNDWKKHTRRHTGELYNCDICAENNELKTTIGFSKYSELKHHKLTMHLVNDTNKSQINQYVTLNESDQLINRYSRPPPIWPGAKFI